MSILLPPVFCQILENRRFFIVIYTRIKQICNEKGASVKSVENKAGLGNGAISKWDKHSPSLANLQAVARVLDVSVEDIISDEAVV